MSTQAKESKKNIPSTAFTVALALFAVANCLAIPYIPAKPDLSATVTAPDSEKLVPRPWSWWLTRNYLSQKQAPDIVVFGSSQMGSAAATADAQHLLETVDTVTHRRIRSLEDCFKTTPPPVVFTTATPGAMISDDYMMARALFDRKLKLKPRLAIIGIGPRDFIDNTMTYPAATEPFRFFNQFVASDPLLSSAYNTPMSMLSHAVELLPLSRIGRKIQSDSEPEAQPEDAADGPVDAVMAAIKGTGLVMPGKWIVPANIPYLWVDNTREYKHRFASVNPSLYKTEMGFFAGLLAYLHEEGVKVLVVKMPSMPMNRRLLPDSFWQKFDTDLARCTSDHHAALLDLSRRDDFDVCYFLDTVHLNSAGGQKLFALIAASLASNPQLAPTSLAQRKKNSAI